MTGNASHHGAGTSARVLNAAPDIGPRTLAQPPSSALRQAIDTLLLWQDRRRQRRELAMLSDGLLKDIGISRLDASWEWRKWPWRE